MHSPASEAIVLDHSLRLKHPCTICVVGGSDSGKTSFILKLVQYKDDVFAGAPFNHFYWCLPEEAPVPAAIAAHEPPFTILRGLPKKSDILNDSLLIIDDLGRAAQSPAVADFWTIHSHHSRITCVLTLHNLFYKSPYSRDIALSTKYTVFLRQPRSPASFLHYAVQTLGKGAANSLYQCYLEANKKPYAHFISDCTQTCPPALRFRSNIFPDAPHGLEVFATPEEMNALLSDEGSQYGAVTETE